MITSKIFLSDYTDGYPEGYPDAYPGSTGPFSREIDRNQVARGLDYVSNNRQNVRMPQELDPFICSL